MSHVALSSRVINLTDAHNLRCGELIEALELISGDDELSLGTCHLRAQILCSNLCGRVIQPCNELTCFDPLPDFATQTTRPAMTLATRASERLTIEPGIQLLADTERVVTVPTCTATGGPAG